MYVKLPLFVVMLALGAWAVQAQERDQDRPPDAPRSAEAQPPAPQDEIPPPPAGNRRDDRRDDRRDARDDRRDRDYRDSPSDLQPRLDSDRTSRSYQPGKGPYQGPMQAPGKSPQQAPGKDMAQAPMQAPGKGPGQAPMQAPGKGYGQIYSQPYQAGYRPAYTTSRPAPRYTARRGLFGRWR